MPALAHAKEPLDGCGLLLARVNEPSGLFSSAGSHANEREPLDGCGLLLARGIRGSKPRPPRGSSVVGGLARPPCAEAGAGSRAESGRAAPPACGLDASGGLRARKSAARRFLFAIWTHPTRARQGALRRLPSSRVAGKGHAALRSPANASKSEKAGLEGRFSPARSPPDASRPRSRRAGPAAAGGEAAAGNVGARPGM